MHACMNECQHACFCACKRVCRHICVYLRMHACMYLVIYIASFVTLKTRILENISSALTGTVRISIERLFQKDGPMDQEESALQCSSHCRRDAWNKKTPHTRKKTPQISDRRRAITQDRKIAPREAILGPWRMALRRSLDFC